MAKIGHNAKSIASVKCSFQVKNLKCHKGAKKDSTRTLEFFCAKKPLQKTPNIRKMRAF